MKRTLLLILLLVPALLFAQPAMHPTPPRVPDYVVFAGDTVRLDRQDFRERMDRELISFTYMHTNSTLMLRRSRRMFGLVT
nr:lytic transglycosylase domain-containing protein [Bacteroidales bacterium]